MMRTDSTDKAFSLIELLVTISIMSLLMALFLPALSATRRASQSARCLANADQFGKAFQTFLGENKGKFPVLLDEVKKGHWVVELNRHLGDREWYLDSGTVQDESDAPSVWVCPYDENANPMGYAPVGTNLVAFPKRPPYTFPEGHKPWFLYDVPRPSQTIAVSECWVPVPQLFPPYGEKPFLLDSDLDNDGFLDSNGLIAAGFHSINNMPVAYNNVAARHPQRTANIAFVDGHAKSWKIQDIMREEQDIWGSDMPWDLRRY